MRRGTIALLLTVTWGAVGCVDGQRYDTQAAELLPSGMSGPMDAPKGSCWQKNITPAEFDTVTRQMRVPLQKNPAQSDEQTKATPQYQTKTRHVMVKKRNEAWFETLCPAQLNKALVTALQHALQAQKLYHGAIHGRLTDETRTAIRTLQHKDGINSDVLGLRTAETLGLLRLAKK